MKQIIKSLGMAVAIAFCSVNASAQFFGGEGGPFGGEGGPQRMSVEEMAKTQGTSIAKGLKLKKAETKKVCGYLHGISKGTATAAPQHGTPRPQGAQRPQKK